MRIVSYNILNGGEGRADPLAEVLEAQKPDVVALVEADDLAVVERIASRLKMDFIYAPGNSKATAILTRGIIRESINHAALRPGISKTFLEATVSLPNGGGEMVVAVAHLHAHAKVEDETIRIKEIGIILDCLAVHRAAGRPHVLLGDFNSNSPHQKIGPENLKESSKKEYLENGNQLPRDVIAQIESAGYIDTLRHLHAHEADNTGTFSTQHPGQRIDYIFIHSMEAKAIKEAWIEYDRLAKYASDHFPVGVELEYDCLKGDE